MPTETADFGPIAIPVPTAGQDSDLEDKTLTGVLDFIGFVIKDGLDGKLGEQRGPVDSNAVSDACPVANRFPWDLGDSFVQKPRPSLSAWETSSGPDDGMSTLLYAAYRRDITVRYIFHPVSNPNGMQNRHGLIPIVTKIMARAAERGSHLSYGYNGDPNCTPIHQSLNWLKWRFIGATGGFLNATPGGAANTQVGRNVSYESKVYPFADVQLRVWERMEPLQPSGDVMQDGTIDLKHAEDLPGISRVLEIDNG